MVKIKKQLKLKFRPSYKRVDRSEVKSIIQFQFLFSFQ